MPECQAFNCVNIRGKAKTSFHQFPNPNESRAERARCRRWIEVIRNAKLNVDAIGVDPSRYVVCGEHFTSDSFTGFLASKVADSLGYKPRRRLLKPDAVPTIVSVGDPVEPKIRASTELILKKRRDAQIRDELKLERRLAKQRLEIPSCEVPVTDGFEEVLTIGESATDAAHNEHIQDPVVDDVGQTAEPYEEPNVLQPQTVVLGCGHPCGTCLDSISRSSLLCDHNYTKLVPRGMKDISCQTDFGDCVTEAEPCVTSTPQKPSTSCVLSANVSTLPVCDDPVMDDDDDLLDLSKISSFRDDSRDKTFVCSDYDSEEEDKKVTEVEVNYVNEPKYIVFGSALDELFVRLKCNECECPVDPDDIRKSDADGTILRCSIYCTGGHLVHRWHSQPVLGNMPVGNLLVSAALLFSGQTFTSISQLSSFLNLKFLSHTTFNTIQRQYVMPVIMYTWSQLQHKLLQNVRSSGKMLRLAGDGRCESPGFSAKYCTYSLLDMDTDTIVTFVVVQVSETGSSAKMEAEAFRRCMTYLLDLGFTIQVLATDRHVQIRSIMSKEYSSTNHQFDVWHLSNNLKKKLVQKAKGKGCEELGLWIKAICNHLWWCASNCNGDTDWLQESWTSVVHHIVNQHSFTGEHITQCPHEPLDPEVARKKKWLKRDSKAHNALKEVVLDKRLVKDISQLSEFCHTGSLEVYHSLMTKYVPKRQEFDQDQMTARTALAVLDHNMSVNRQQATNKKGEKRYRMVSPKATSQWVVKPVYEAKSYDWVNAMMCKVVKERECRSLSPVTVKKGGNIAPHPAPPKAGLVSSLMSRFAKLAK